MRFKSRTKSCYCIDFVWAVHYYYDHTVYIVTPHLASFVFKLTAVDIGFLAPQFFTMENESAAAMVCAEIDRGSLEREVVAYLSTIPGGTATRKHKHNVKCPLAQGIFKQPY